MVRTCRDHLCASAHWIRHRPASGTPIADSFRNLRKHAFETFFDCIHFSDATGVEDNTTLVDIFFCNPAFVDAAYRAAVQNGLRFDEDDAETAATCMLLMYIIDGSALGQLVWFGYRLVGRQRYEWTPSREAVDNCIPLRLVNNDSHAVFASLHGVIFGTAIRRIPTIDGATWGLMCVGIDEIAQNTLWL